MATKKSAKAATSNDENVQVDWSDLTIENCECPDMLNELKVARQHFNSQALNFKAADLLYSTLSSKIMDKFSEGEEYVVIINLDKDFVGRVPNSEYKKAVAKAKRRKTAAAKKRAPKKRPAKKSPAKKSRSKRPSK